MEEEAMKEKKRSSGAFLNGLSPGTRPFMNMYPKRGKAGAKFRGGLLPATQFAP